MNTIKYSTIGSFKQLLSFLQKDPEETEILLYPSQLLLNNLLLHTHPNIKYQCVIKANKVRWDQLDVTINLLLDENSSIKSFILFDKIPVQYIHVSFKDFYVNKEGQYVTDKLQQDIEMIYTVIYAINIIPKKLN